MKNRLVHIRNLLANWGSHAANLLIMFFLSPFIIHTLGTVEYGIWSLLTVLTGYMGVIDLGVRASTGRHVYLYLGKNDDDKVNKTIQTGIGFYVLLGFVLVLIALVLGVAFPNFFRSVPENYNTCVRILLPVMAFKVLLSAISAIFSSVLAAHDRFDLTRGVDFIVLIFRAVAVVVLLKLGYGIVGLAAVTMLCSFFGLLGNFILAKNIYSNLAVFPVRIEKERLSELMGYGSAAFISAIAVKLMGQTDLVIVGSLISVSEVAVYSVGAMLIFYSSTFIDLIAVTFFPPLQKAIAREEIENARWLFLRQARLGLLCGIPMYIGMLLFSNEFIRLWMLGPEFGESEVARAALVMTILAASKLAYLFTSGSRQVLAAMGHIRFNAIITIIEAVLNIALSVVFVAVFDFGLAGIAGGTLVARIIMETYFFPWYACRKIGVRGGKYLVNIGVTGFVSALLFGGWCLWVQQLIIEKTWIEFTMRVLLALVGYIPIAVFMLLPKKDRERLWQFLPFRHA